MERRRTSLKAGFTLVELMVAMAIALILMTGVYQFFIRQQKTYSTQDEVLRVQQEARVAQEIVTNAIQQAGAILPTGGSSGSLPGQAILAAADRYITIQYDDPLRTADLGEIAREEVITFAVSKTAPGSGTPTESFTYDAFYGGATHTITVPLDLGGPPYTLYRITADASGNPQPEAIATNVDDLVFTYYNPDGNPIILDPAGTGAPANPPYALDEEDRALIRSVEMTLALRTRSEDRDYTPPTAFAALVGSVATYNAAGTAPTGATGATTNPFAGDQYRRRVFKTRITPRNLSANTCGWIKMDASPNPIPCPTTLPGTTQVTAEVFNQNGAHVPDGTLVTFSVMPSGINATVTPSGTTTGGVATTTLSYPVPPPGLARVISVAASSQIPCLAGGVTTSATVSNAVAVSFTPGDPVRIEVTDVPHTPADCSAPGGGFLDSADMSCTPGSFIFKAHAYDACNNEVDPQAGLSFGATVGASPADVSPGTFTTTGEPFTVRLPTSAFSPGAASPTYSLQVSATTPAWLTGGITAVDDQTHNLGFPFTMRVRPWPPKEIGWPGAPFANILATAAGLPGQAYQDCPLPTDPVDDYFFVYDCFQNPVFSLGGGGARVEAALDPTGTPAATGGSIDSAGKPGSGAGTGVPADPLKIVDSTGAQGEYHLQYQAPGCSELDIDPNTPKTTYLPQLGLNLVGGTQPSNSTTGVPLAACIESCSITGTPPGGGVATSNLTLTQCETPGTVEITLNQCQNEPMILEVTSSGGTAGFLNDPQGTPQDIEATPGTPVQLQITQATNGATFTVTAKHKTQGWSCPGNLVITVENLCNDMGIFADNTYTQDLLLGGSDCLSSLRELFFQVEDCRFTTARVSASPPDRGLWASIVLDDGTVYDREYVDLDPVLVAGQSPQDLRSVIGLPFLRDDTGPFNTQNRILEFPSGQSVTLLAQYTDPTDTTDNPSRNQCEKRLRLTAPVPVCFPNAITSGGGAGWNGNFKVHWGDVVVRGNISLPSKFIEKSSTGQFNGSGFGGAPAQTDRFADIYVGKAFPGDAATGNFIGVANPTPDVLDQPFLDPANSQPYGNYFRNISYAKITDMIVVIDYETMKALAQDRGTYWYTLPGGDIRNPATGQVASLQTVLDLPGPGLENAYYDGDFIFVDTFGTATTAPSPTGGQIDAAADAGTLPVFSISGNFYTEGIIYIAGTIDFGGLGPTTAIVADTPPEYEAHYNQNTPGWIAAEDQLPIRSDPNQPQQQFTIDVHINGAVYVDGEVTGSGNPSVFGSVTAERGYTGTGTPEIWYNYNLNVSGLNQSLCVDCCIMRLSPTSANLVPGETLQLTPINPSGAVDWSVHSEIPRVAGQAVATLGAGGLVTAKNPGTITIRARDPNNCVALATIFVQEPCERFAQPGNLTPQWASVDPGLSQTFQLGYSPSGSVNWSIQAWPATGGTLIGSGADWAEVMGNCPGSWVDVKVEDPACPNPLWAGLWVPHPANWTCSMSLDQKPATIQNGSTFSFQALNSTCNAAWWWASASDGGTYGVFTPDPVDTTRATFEATADTPPGTTVTVNVSDSGGCWDSATFTVSSCPTITIAQNPPGNPLLVNTTYTLTAAGGDEDYTWVNDTSGAGAANGTLATSLSPNTETATFQPTSTGNVVIRVTDADGCSGELRSWATCQPPTVTVPTPVANSTYGALTANGTSMVIQGIPDDRNGALPLDDIDRVEFVVTRNATGAVVLSTSETVSEYCGFGSDDCTANPGDVSAWPDGEYTLRVTAYTKATHPCGATSVSQWVPFSVYNTACPLTIDPPAPRSVRKNDSVILTALDPVGTVNWLSQDASLATVSPASGDSTRVETTNSPNKTVFIRASDSRCFVDYRVNIIP